MVASSRTWWPRPSVWVGLIACVSLLSVGLASGHVDLFVVAGIVPVFGSASGTGLLILVAVIGILVALVLGSMMQDVHGELPPEAFAAPRWHPAHGQVDPRDLVDHQREQEAAVREAERARQRVGGVVFLGPIPIPIVGGLRPWMLVVSVFIMGLMAYAWFG